MSTETHSLLDYIDSVKREGASDEFVVSLLRQHGWSEKRIYPAFASWYQARTGKPVPNGGGRIEAAKDAFLYLLAFLTLGTWAIQMGALLFTAIDRTFPNPAIDYATATGAGAEIAAELASVLVGFPLFLLVMRQIVHDAARQPERLESPVRKWLTYLALVITAGTMIGDAVTFLAFLLRGDLDSRFVLKVVAVLAIAGGVFAYYLGSMARDSVSSGRNRLFAVAASVAVVFTIVVGFVQIGSPRLQRTHAEDARRLFDLSAIAQTLHGEWVGHRAEGFTLPPTLRNLQTVQGERTVDPVTGTPYEYAPLDATAYRLCATFAQPSPPEDLVPWRHGAGRACFTLDARDNVPWVPRRW